MRKQILTAAVAVTITLGLATVPVTQAAAQWSLISFCNGALRPSTIQTTTDVSGGRTTVTYWVSMVNMTPNEVRFSLSYVGFLLTNRANGTELVTLAPRGYSRQVFLGQKPRNSETFLYRDLPAGMRVTCT